MLAPNDGARGITIEAPMTDHDLRLWCMDQAMKALPYLATPTTADVIALAQAIMDFVKAANEEQGA